MKLTCPVVVLFAVTATTASLAQDQAPLPRLGDVQQFALKYPKPPYPKKARVQHLHGSGIFSLDIDVDSGQVIDVTVFKSTGSKLLDDSAVETLRRWEFRPHTLVGAKVPINFTLNAKKH